MCLLPQVLVTLTQNFIMGVLGFLKILVDVCIVEKITDFYNCWVGFKIIHRFNCGLKLTLNPTENAHLLSFDNEDLAKTV